MAVYDPISHRWVLDSTESNFAMPAGTTNDGIIGNELSNLLTGDNGNNVIQGGDGAGDDTLVGGLGNDEYAINGVNDIVMEEFNQGIDWIFLNLPGNGPVIDNYIITDNIEKANFTALH